MEKLLIKKLNSNNKLYGYNITSGGEGVCGLIPWNKGGHLYEETKEKMSKSLKGRHIDDDWKRNIGNAVKKRWEEGGDLRKRMLGENNPNYGKSGYFKDKKGFDNPTSKPVICLNTLTIFGSSSIASEKTGVSFSDICACCRGTKHAIAKDSEGIPLVWLWYDDYNKMSKQEIKEYIWDRLLKTKYKPIVNMDTMELFCNVKLAVSYYSNSSDTSHFVKYIKSNKKIYGHNWKYYVDYLKENNLTPLEARKSLFFIA
jgi:hypothetical protein